MNSDRPVIGINLLYIRPGYMGGTVRYAFEVANYLNQLGRFRLILYVQRGVISFDNKQLSSITRREYKIACGLLGRVTFEQLILPFLAHRDGLDLLFSPGFVSPLWGSFKKVITIHDMYYYFFPKFVRPWQRRYWQIFLPLSLRAIDAAIAVSDSTYADIRIAYSWSERKLKRIYLGANALGEPQSGMLQDDLYCLIVGNITPNKNIDTVLEAFALLKKHCIKCRLVVAGSDLLGLLDRGIKLSSLNYDVRVIERVEDSLLSSLYSHAVCLIQASHYEGFGLPVIEAMNAGCPVVASDIPVLREIGSNAAMYFPPQSPTALCEAIIAMIENQEMRSKLISLGRKNALRFTWQNTGIQTAELFDTVLEGNIG